MKKIVVHQNAFLLYFISIILVFVCYLYEQRVAVFAQRGVLEALVYLKLLATMKSRFWSLEFLNRENAQISSFKKSI